MVASLRVCVFCFIFLLSRHAYGLSHQAKATADILINGASEPFPPPGTDPLIARLHLNNGSGSNTQSSTSLDSSLAQQTAVSQNENPQQNPQSAPPPEANPFSALQTSQEHEEECSCVFAGACLYKGACLWIAGSLSFGVLVLLFLVAWGLQWVVAIPAEWILAKKTVREGKVKGSSSESTSSAPLLQD